LNINGDIHNIGVALLPSPRLAPRQNMLAPLFSSVLVALLPSPRLAPRFYTFITFHDKCTHLVRFITRRCFSSRSYCGPVLCTQYKCRDTSIATLTIGFPLTHQYTNAHIVRHCPPVSRFYRDLLSSTPRTMIQQYVAETLHRRVASMGDATSPLTHTI